MKKQKFKMHFFSRGFDGSWCGQPLFSRWHRALPRVDGKPLLTVKWEEVNCKVCLERRDIWRDENDGAIPDCYSNPRLKKKKTHVVSLRHPYGWPDMDKKVASLEKKLDPG